MKNLVRDLIERIYQNNDYKFYTLQCEQELILPQEFYSVLNNSASTIVDSMLPKMWPAKEWLIKFEKFVVGDFNASFRTNLIISKIVPLFYLQHVFEVENKVPKRIEPILYGDSGMPYITPQLDLHEQVSKILCESGYLELSYAEMHEVVCELSFSEGVTIFGSQVTVQYALFHDLLDLCSD